MYRWMHRLVGLGAVVAEDSFSTLNWEHWQWKLFSLSKRTWRSFSGVWKVFVTVRITKDFSDTRWMIAEWELDISFSVCCTLVGNGKVDSVSTFNSSGSDCELLCIAIFVWKQGGWWLSECEDHCELVNFVYYNITATHHTLCSKLIMLFTNIYPSHHLSIIEAHVPNKVCFDIWKELYTTPMYLCTKLTCMQKPWKVGGYYSRV